MGDHGWSLPKSLGGVGSPRGVFDAKINAEVYSVHKTRRVLNAACNDVVVTVARGHLTVQPKATLDPFLRVPLESVAGVRRQRGHEGVEIDTDYGTSVTLAAVNGGWATDHLKTLMDQVSKGMLAGFDAPREAGRAPAYPPPPAAATPAWPPTPAETPRYAATPTETVRGYGDTPAWPATPDGAVAVSSLPIAHQAAATPGGGGGVGYSECEQRKSRYVVPVEAAGPPGHPGTQQGQIPHGTGSAPVSPVRGRGPRRRGGSPPVSSGVSEGSSGTAPSPKQRVQRTLSPEAFPSAKQPPKRTPSSHTPAASAASLGSHTLSATLRQQDYVSVRSASPTLVGAGWKEPPAGGHGGGASPHEPAFPPPPPSPEAPAARRQYSQSPDGHRPRRSPARVGSQSPYSPPPSPSARRASIAGSPKWPPSPGRFRLASPPAAPLTPKRAPTPPPSLPSSQRPAVASPISRASQPRPQLALKSSATGPGAVKSPPVERSFRIVASAPLGVKQPAPKPGTKGALPGPPKAAPRRGGSPRTPPMLSQPRITKVDSILSVAASTSQPTVPASGGGQPQPPALRSSLKGQGAVHAHPSTPSVGVKMLHNPGSGAALSVRSRLSSVRIADRVTEVHPTGGSSQTELAPPSPMHLPPERTDTDTDGTEAAGPSPSASPVFSSSYGVVSAPTEEAPLDSGNAARRRAAAAATTCRWCHLPATVEHELHLCAYRQVLCPQCSETMPAMDYPQHARACIGQRGSMLEEL